MNYKDILLEGKIDSGILFSMSNENIKELYKVIKR